MPTVAKLGLDQNGNSEQNRNAAYDFKNFPEIINGATLQLSPAPTFQQVQQVVAGVTMPQITFGTPQIQGVQVVVPVSITGGQVNVKYPTLCIAHISATQTLYCYGDILTIGMR